MPGSKPKSAVTPIKTVRSYAKGLNRTERRIRKLLERQGKDSGYPLDRGRPGRGPRRRR